MALLPDKNRFWLVAAVIMFFYMVLLVLLNQLWYAKQATANFHFFDDWEEWNGLDKLGHFYTAFHVSDMSIKMMLWLKVSRKNAIVGGTLAGILFQTPIEIMDGFGTGYGFSWADMLANVVGSSFVLFQYLLWNEIKILPKFSFFPSGLAALRPNLLGNTLLQQVLKDYNGQTYWFSFPLPFLPKWLRLAIGYGSHDMIFARPAQNSTNGYEMYQQFYLSIDIDLEQIPTKNNFLKTIYYFANKIRLPFPALEWNEKQGLLTHLLFF
ncbi:MAG: DUF2279 domain-containing protein [Verrucomicrobia bacterium]|nr:DUF2279 domain-containing protein [Cytophagales bacterium]